MSVEVKAQNSISLTSVKAIKDATDQSAQLLATMEQYAEEAGTSLTGIYQDAEDAKASAETAYTSAEIAQTQLSIVENVVGVLDLVSKHGFYVLTSDTEVQPDKWYFTVTGVAVTNPVASGLPSYYELNDGVYTLTEDTSVDVGKTYYTVTASVVNDPVDADLGAYYNLLGVDEAIQNYVSSQLYVDEHGLWLKTAGMQTKVLLSATDGVVLYGTDGQVVGKYGSTAQIGDSNSFHIEMDGTELGFYEGVNKVAYISNQQLYITQSVVLQQMDLGTLVNDGGLGQWSWKIHPNGDNPSRNNLNLKWVG